jgi:hypothetical protein
MTGRRPISWNSRKKRKRISSRKNLYNLDPAAENFNSLLPNCENFTAECHGWPSAHLLKATCSGGFTIIGIEDAPPVSMQRGCVWVLRLEPGLA